MSGARVYTISEVARRLKVTRKTVRAWIKKGEIEAVPLDNSRQVITQSTLDHLLKTVSPVEQRRAKGGAGTKYLLYDKVKKVRGSKRK